ncbi:MAG: RNB domain-containing ribonuclease, partial [Peptococcaceae bacterium]|nr:RNB domain-containing ribonuclease [Peptococcaceae bacterium]
MNTETIYKILQEEMAGPKSLQDILQIPALKSFKPLEIKEALSALEKSGKLIKNRANRYGIPEQMNLFTGRVKKNKKGFGFFVTEDLDTEDLFIPPNRLNTAQNGDRVIVRLMKQGHMPKDGSHKEECEVVRILHRENTTFVGTYTVKPSYIYVSPDNPTFGQDIIVAPDTHFQAASGDKVLVEITSWGDHRELPEGKVIARLGKAGAPGIDVLSLVYRYNLSPSFTQAQLAEAKRIRQTPMDYRLDQRRDYRYYNHVVTIDGADSKDLDDAVYLDQLDNGHYILGVHIADVSEYIKEGSILDQEAYRRGTSVYFVDRVLPMLPPDISNDICSLNAGEDRLTLSCIMEINRKGQVVASDICESVINVEKRFTYDTVNGILKDQRFEDPSYVEYFNHMNALSKQLHQNRVDRGALEFNFPESKVLLDDQGHVTDIVNRERGDAEKMIEEFMILA